MLYQAALEFQLSSLAVGLYLKEEMQRMMLESRGPQSTSSYASTLLQFSISVWIALSMIHRGANRSRLSLTGLSPIKACISRRIFCSEDARFSGELGAVLRPQNRFSSPILADRMTPLSLMNRGRHDPFDDPLSSTYTHQGSARTRLSVLYFTWTDAGGSLG